MEYKVAYSHIENAGDLLNIYIMSNIFGIKIKQAGYLTADIVGIGSCLGEFQYSESLKRRFKQLIAKDQRVYVWGTGFINSEKKNERNFCNKKMIFLALRGNLSKRRVEKIIGKSLGDIPLCDGGILTACLFDNVNIEKKYTVGIIPHYKEQEHPAFQKLLSVFKNSVFIDLKKDPMEVYKEIGSCEYVLSSSLHGLIISDSFGIPNLHIKATNNLKGDGFKFDDYYSGYELEDNPLDINSKVPSINDIIDRYKIKPEIVEMKKKEMIDCFPFHK